MRDNPRMTRTFALVATLGVLVSGYPGTPVSAQAGSRLKLAFFNIQSGIGEVGLAGRPVLFSDTSPAATSGGFLPASATERRGVPSRRRSTLAREMHLQD